MEVSLLLAEQILAMFFMGVLGFAIVRMKLLASEDSRVLSKVCVYVCTPCMIIDSFQLKRTPEVVSGLMLALAVSVIFHIIYIGFCRLGRNILRLTTVERASVIYANVGNLVIPLVPVVFGAEWVIYACAFIIVQTILVWTHGKLLLSHGGGKVDWKKVFGNINIIAIGIGAVLFVTQLSLPGILGDVTGRMGSMMGPISMLVMGMLIGNMNLSELFRNRRVYFICFLRLILCPALSLLFVLCSGVGYWHPDAHTIFEVIILAGASASATTVTQMVQVFGGDSRHANNINVVTIILCIITMPVMTYIYEMVVRF